MINQELLELANKSLKTTRLEIETKSGKKIENDYIDVAERVKAFRLICPNGTIETNIISEDVGFVVMKTFIKDEDGKLLATGMAYEREDSNPINRTSYIENCETSSVGRALGFLGIGIDTSIASADEVKLAVDKQNQEPQPKPKVANGSAEKPKSKFQQIKAMIEGTTITLEKITEAIKRKYNKEKINDLTDEEFGFLVSIGIPHQLEYDKKKAEQEQQAIEERVVEDEYKVEEDYLPF